MIKIFCDICGKEPEDKDFSFEATKQEIVATFGNDPLPQQRLHKELFQICKGCFYKHIFKHLNEKI